MVKHAYTIDEAREQLGGMSRAVFYEQLKHGRLTTYTVGRRRYVSDDALSVYVKAREGESRDVASEVAS